MYHHITQCFKVQIVSRNSILSYKQSTVLLLNENSLNLTYFSISKSLDFFVVDDSVQYSITISTFRDLSMMD